MATFDHAIKVMFQHCDPAGIVFYPRLFEMVNAVVETFFDEAVGWSFAAMHGPVRRGVPTARMEAEFHAPSRLGETLDWRLSVVRIGGASLDLVLRASCGSEARVTARGTLVLVDLDTMRAARWPEDRRAMLGRYEEEAT